MRPDTIHARLPPHLSRWSTELIAAELITGIDVFTLAAIMDRESRGGDACRPRGPTGTGDNGRAYGLMQIDGRYHASFIKLRLPDGVPAWSHPGWNILYGASLLRTNMLRAKGDLLVAVAGYNASLVKAIKVAELLPVSGSPEERHRTKIAALDVITTGKNYVSWIFERRAQFLHDSQAPTS